MDPNPHGSAFIHEQKCKEIATVITERLLICSKVNLHKLHCSCFWAIFYYFMFVTTIENSWLVGLIQILLKGQSNEIFDLQFFFIIRTGLSHWPIGKIFSFLVSFSSIYSYFSRAPRSMILRGVKLRALSYCAESSSARYDTARSQFFRYYNTNIFTKTKPKTKIF